MQLELGSAMSGVMVLPWLCMLVVLCGVVPAQCVEPMMPAMFILGDSLVDPGNNNYILSLARANYPPNGLDFPRGPTGRFSNNKTAADHIGAL